MSAHLEHTAFDGAMSCSRLCRPIVESPFGQLVFDSSQQRLLCRLSSSQSVDSNESIIEIHLSSDQPMRPVFIHREAVSQQCHYPFLAGAPQVDDSSAWVSLKVELPRSWERPAYGSLLDPTVQVAAVGCDVSGGLDLQSSQGLVMEALPDFGLPTAVETLDGSLKTGFSRRGKDGSDAQAQAKPDHPADRIGGAVVPLEAGVVVELSVSRQAKSTPVLAHGRDDFGGWDVSVRPAGYQAAVERDPGKDIDVNAALNHQIFDHVETIELTSACGDIRQIPAGKWRPMPEPSATIKGATPFEDSADRTDRRQWANAPADELTMDSRSAVFTQHTGFLELAANRQHKILNRSLDPSGSVGRTRAVIPIQLSQGFIPGTPHPIMDGTDTNTKAPRNASDRSTTAGGSHHILSLFSLRAFFFIIGLPKTSFLPTVKDR